MRRNARTRAIAEGVPFALATQDIRALLESTAGRCPVTLRPFAIRDGRGPGPDSPTLDRLKPSNGYTVPNCAVLSHTANLMKGSQTLAQLQFRLATLRRYAAGEITHTRVTALGLATSSRESLLTEYLPRLARLVESVECRTIDAAKHTH